MNDFREIDKGKIKSELQEYLERFRLGLLFHEYRWAGETCYVIEALLKFANNIGAITDSEKEELVNEVDKEKERIKEEIKYGNI